MQRICLWFLLTISTAALIQYEIARQPNGHYQSPTNRLVAQQNRIQIGSLPGPVVIGPRPGQITAPPLPPEKFDGCRDDGKKSASPRISVDCGCNMACAREVLGPSSLPAQHDPKCSTNCKPGNCKCVGMKSHCQ